MKPRSRYRLLIVIGILGAMLARGAWKGVTAESPNNQGGALFGLFFLLIVVCMYASTAAEWIANKIHMRLGKPIDTPETTRPPDSQ